MARRPAAPRAARDGQVPPAAGARAGVGAAASESTRGGGTPTFPGFERPGANFVLTPNQYLDLCVPHCSRGVIRVVGFLIRQVLGWSDREGRPLRETVRVSYSRIIDEAGVSRGAAREALEEAEAARFVRRLRDGSPNRAGVAGHAAEFALNWDEGGGYADSLDAFAGFYTGEGRRTMIPNAFFDLVLPHEPHGVVKVVAAVLRHTVGYTNRYTGLPQETAPLSYRKLMRYAAMDRRTIRRALPAALDARYVRVVEVGRFTPGEQAGEASVYAVCWRSDGGQNAGEIGDGSKLPPAQNAANRGTVQNRPPSNGSKSPPAHGPVSPPVSVQNRPPQASKTAPTRKTDSKKEQTQPKAAVLPFAAQEELLNGLREAGLSDAMAARLLRDAGSEEVARQLAWLDARDPKRNRAGMLRRAIEERWAEPKGLPAKRRPTAPSPEDTAAKQRAREAYEHRHRDAYLAEVAEVERRVQADQPARYTSFTQARAERRRALDEESATYPRSMRSSVMNRFDSEASRLAEFAEAFRADIPDFWTWDARRRQSADVAGGESAR